RDRAAGRLQSGDGGDVDDAPAALRAHGRGGGARELERAAHVRVKDPFPDLRRERVEVGERDADVPPGVVHEDVETAELARGARHGRLDRRRLGLVQLYAVRLAAELLHRAHGVVGALAIADVADG